MNLTQFTYSQILAPVPSGQLVSLDANGEVVFVVDQDPAAARAQIMTLKDRLLSQPGEHIEMPVEHTLADGMYMRKLFIPKGSILVGKIHKKPCMNIVASGDISVMTETGSLRVQAGYTVATPAGIMKVGYAHEDTVFINVFRTDETDINKIEAEIASEDHGDLAILNIENKEALCL